MAAVFCIQCPAVCEKPDTRITENGSQCQRRSLFREAGSLFWKKYKDLIILLRPGLLCQKLNLFSQKYKIEAGGI